MPLTLARIAEAAEAYQLLEEADVKSLVSNCPTSYSMAQGVVRVLRQEH